jgi:hypothetical protein
MNEVARGIADPAIDDRSAPSDEELTEVVISRETMWAWAAQEAA